MAAESQAFGRKRNAAGQERKPDAGASAGDETLMRQSHDASRVTPIARLGERGIDIGRQVCADGCEIEGSPEIAQMSDHPRAGESGVGSNAGPICIVEHRSKPSPTRSNDRVAQVSAPRNVLRAGAGCHRFIAIPGRLVPQPNHPDDEPHPRFAFLHRPGLSARPCGRELA